MGVKGEPTACATCSYLSQLGPQFCHIVLQGALVTKCGRELGLTSVEHGLQVPDAALGHCELTLPLLGAEPRLAWSFPMLSIYSLY